MSSYLETDNKICDSHKEPDTSQYTMWQLLYNRWRTRRNFHTCFFWVRPPTLHAWSLSATPSNPNTFTLPIIYANIDYLFSRMSNIEDPYLDIDHYLWIICHICKVQNDKLFTGIDKDPLEFVRYVKSECQVWFEANKSIPISPHETYVEEPQLLSLRNICTLDGSWKSASQFSGCGWI